jgi:hypothetical protein
MLHSAAAVEGMGRLPLADHMVLEMEQMLGS